jgi:cytosine/adenosine deaminase-related metal-dependent hydrolase
MATLGSQGMFEAIVCLAGLARLEAGKIQAMTAQRAGDGHDRGARALRLDGEIGSREPKKRIDVICVDLATTFSTSALNLPATLEFTARSRDMSDVIAAGSWCATAG